MVAEEEEEEAEEGEGMVRTGGYGSWTGMLVDNVFWVGMWSRQQRSDYLVALKPQRAWLCPQSLLASALSTRAVVTHADTSSLSADAWQ